MQTVDLDHNHGLAKMLDTESAACDWDSFQPKLQAMSDACCGLTDPDATCSGGAPPATCDAQCAVSFHTFITDCSQLVTTVMHSQDAAYQSFDTKCLDSADHDVRSQAIADAAVCFLGFFFLRKLWRDYRSHSG